MKKSRNGLQQGLLQPTQIWTGSSTGKQSKSMKRKLTGRKRLPSAEMPGPWEQGPQPHCSFPSSSITHTPQNPHGPPHARMDRTGAEGTATCVSSAPPRECRQTAYAPWAHGDQGQGKRNGHYGQQSEIMYVQIHWAPLPLNVSHEKHARAFLALPVSIQCWIKY